MFLQITTVDLETFLINTNTISMMKLHPTERKPTCGIVILGARELFVTLPSYKTLLEKLNAIEKAAGSESKN